MNILMVDSVNPYRSSVGFHIKTSHLICTGNQMNCFYMKDNTAWNWVQVAITKYFLTCDSLLVGKVCRSRILLIILIHQ